jgi:hypothetical protein
MVSGIRDASEPGTHVMFVAAITLLYDDHEAMRFERGARRRSLDEVLALWYQHRPHPDGLCDRRAEEWMPEPQMVMFAEEFHQIQGIVDSLVKSSNASVVFIIDKNGQLIAASGESDNIDTTSLASLTAGNIAATGCANASSLRSFTRARTRTSIFSWSTIE